MKHILPFVSAALAGILTVGLAACSAGNVNVYDVATTLGYEGDESGWIANVTGSSTEAHTLYEEAKADGYTGTFVDFLKEIGYTAADNSSSVSNAMMSVVAVQCGFEEASYTYVNGKPVYQAKTVYSAGSGVIYSVDREQGDAYIVTNYHVVYDKDSVGSETVANISDDISVYLYGSTFGGEDGAIEASYVGGAMDYDVAVLRVENSDVLKNSYAVSLKAADSDAITAGERVYAVGNPEGKGFSVVEGIVSVEAEYITMMNADEKSQVSRLEIRTDAPVNHGNSGGGLFNADGRLIGVVNARSEESGVVGFGYAIPANLALAIAQNVIDNSKINSSKGAFRAILGITVQTADSRSVFDEDTQKAYIMETVTVQSVTIGGAVYGKLKTGDVIYSLRINDGAEKIVTRMHMIGNTLFNVRLGDTVTLTVYRDGEIKTVTVPFLSNSMFTLYN